MRHIIQIDDLVLTAESDEALWVLQGIAAAALPAVTALKDDYRELEKLKALRGVLTGYMAHTGLVACKQDPTVSDLDGTVTKVIGAPAHLLGRIGTAVGRLGSASAEHLMAVTNRLATEE